MYVKDILILFQTPRDRKNKFFNGSETTATEITHCPKKMLP